MKKALIIAISLVLVAALAIGGTFAYLTSVDQDVNVMVVGNVKIEQHEYERVLDEYGKPTVMNDTYPTEYAIQDYSQGKKILPKVGEVELETYDSGTGEHLGYANPQTWEQLGLYNENGDPITSGLLSDKARNVQDKFVFVENKGNTDVYFRTLIAIEDPEGSEVTDNTTGATTKAIQYIAGDGYNYEEVSGNFEVDGVRYRLIIATYGGKLLAGELSLPSLLQVYMLSECTNKEVETFGDTLNVLVKTQAVQADGFEGLGAIDPENQISDEKYALDAAFGEIYTVSAGVNGEEVQINNPWADELIEVSSSEDIAAAVKDGAKSVVLTDDVALSGVLEVNGDLTIIGNGSNVITAPASGTRVVNVEGNTEDVNITISGAKLEAADKERGISFYANEGELNVNVVDSEIVAEHYGVNVASDNANATLSFKNTKLTGYAAFQTWSANTVATFDNCTLEGVNKWSGSSDAFATIVVNAPATGAKLTFNNCTVIATQQGGAVQYHFADMAGDAEVEWNNCTFITDGTEVATVNAYVASNP